MVPLLLDEGPILGHVVKRLKDRLQGDLVFRGEFFWRERIRAVDRFIDHRSPDSPPFEE